jgi:hypothetical protein
MLIAVTTALALSAAIFFARRQPEPPTYRLLPAFGADGICRGPLALYCGNPRLSVTRSERCPSYEETLDRARAREVLSEGAAGECGPLKWIRANSTDTGQTSYFDARGKLVCVETWQDNYSECSGKSATVTYGNRPECLSKTTMIIKPGRSADTVTE